MENSIKLIILDMLREESKPNPDWKSIQALADKAIAEIDRNEIKLNGLFYQFLDDVDIRNKDQKYGHDQRERITREFELAKISLDRQNR
ncbi:hypothetical protein [Brevundimonas sp.]|uniref:hypothetical protein n=1 Tax=Brevundimonas sp. TaxID=1871086 RepID=UPI003D0EBBF5